VGDDVRTVNPGAIAACSFQVCCGECEFCREGLTGNCTGVPPRSMYGFGELGGDWGGALSDTVRVPFADFMLVPLPGGLDPYALGSFPDNVVDGWRTVGPYLRERPRASVLVVGGGAVSVGLYAAGIAVAMGSSHVTYIDADDRRRTLAAQLGATEVLAAAPERVKPVYDVTVEASASEQGLSVAIRSTRPGGVCTSVGIYYRQQMPMPLLAMYGTGIRFVHGRVNSRQCMPRHHAARGIASVPPGARDRPDGGVGRRAGSAAGSRRQGDRHSTRMTSFALHAARAGARDRVGHLVQREFFLDVASQPAARQVRRKFLHRRGARTDHHAVTPDLAEPVQDRVEQERRGIGQSADVMPALLEQSADGCCVGDSARSRKPRRSRRARIPGLIGRSR